MVLTFERTVADTIERLEHDLGLTSSELAGGLGVTTRTLDRWRKGEFLPNREARERLGQLTSMRLHAADLFHEDARRWLRDELPVLGGLTPAEMIRAGRVDRVAHVLGAIEHGIYL